MSTDGGVNAAEISDNAIVLCCMQVSDAKEQVDGEDDDWIRWFSGGPGSVEGVTKWIVQNQHEWANDGPRRNWSVRSVETGAIVGNVEANLAPSWLSEGEVNISYGVFVKYRGQGFAARAVRLVCQWLTETQPKTKYAIISVEPENEHSLSVPRNLGFAEVGKIENDEGTEMVAFRFALR